jgi:hypothetical protein
VPVSRCLRLPDRAAVSGCSSTPDGGPRTFSATLAGCSIEVDEPDPARRRWLRENLSPFFVLGSSHLPGMTVQVVAGGSLDAANNLLEPDGEYLCYAFESRTGRFPGQRVGDELWLEHEAFGVRLAFSRDRVRLCPVSRTSHVDLSTFRVIRELAVAELHARRTHLQIHAACVEHAGRAIAIIGPKEAGKTTMVAYLCSQLGLPLIANDRVLLAWGDGPLDVTGLPTIVQVRPGTLVQMSSCFRSVPDLDRVRHLTLNEYVAACARLGPRRAAGPLRLSMPQFAHEIRTRLSPGAPLGGIALLRFDPGARGLDVVELDNQETHQAILENSFGRPDAAHDQTAFDDAVAARGHTVPPAVGEPDLHSVTAISVRVGSDFLTSPSIAAELMSVFKRSAA